MSQLPNDDRVERDLRRYLDWQANQLGGAPSAQAVSARIGERVGTGSRAWPIGRLGLPSGAGRTNRVVWVVVLLGLLLALALGVAFVGSPKPRLVVVEPSLPVSPAAIAYHHNGPITIANGSGVMAFDPATGAPTLEAGPAVYVDWSPDGRRLAIVNGARLSVFDTLTSVATPVNPGLTIRSPIAWSPEGNRIAYLDLDGVHVVDVASGADTQLPTLPGSLEATRVPQNRPFWTPDGQVIRYTTQGQTYATRVDGSGASLITLPNTSLVWSLVWSPDGTKVAYLADPPQEPAPTGGDPYALQVWIANADGTHPSKVFERPGCCLGINPIGPIWSPSGTELALDVGAFGLEVIDITSGSARNLGAIPSGDLGWRPVP
jgi:hypothetical protein